MTVHAARFRHRLSRLQLRPRYQGRAGKRHRLSRADGLARRCHGPRLRPHRAAGRLLLRRLSALRRHGRALAYHARRRRQGESGHARARHLQRLPGAVRVGAAAGRADAQRIPQVRLPRRAGCAWSNDRDVLHQVLPQGPGDARCRSRTARATTSPTPQTLDRLEAEGRVVFRYCDEAGQATRGGQPQRGAAQHRRHLRREPAASSA